MFNRNLAYGLQDLFNHNKLNQTTGRRIWNLTYHLETRFYLSVVPVIMQSFKREFF